MNQRKAKGLRSRIADINSRQQKPEYFVNVFYRRAKKLYNATPRDKRQYFDPIEALNKAGKI